MKKRAVLSIFLLGIFVISVLGLSGVSAEFSLGEVYGNGNTTEGYYLEPENAPGGVLSGVVNLSLEDLEYDGLFKVKIRGNGEYIEEEFSVLEILGLNSYTNGEDYNCTTSSCGETYVSTGVGYEEIRFNLNDGMSRVFGFNINGADVFLPQDSFLLNIVSDASSSCNNPLFIDLLNDQVNEWAAYNVLDEYCDSNKGYFEDHVTTEYLEITPEDEYCSKISLSATPKVLVGANIKPDTIADVDLIFSIKDEFGGIFEDCSDGCQCEVRAPNEESQVSCEIEFSNIKSKEIELCISADSSAGKYLIKAESNNVQGYTFSGGEYDFDVFVKKALYDEIGEFELSTSALDEIGFSLSDEDNLEGIIDNYLSDIYSSECSGGCIVPINFSSNINQNLNISKVSISYTSGGTKISKKLYDIESSSSIIDMDNQIIDFSRLGINVPMKKGTYDVDFYLNDNEIFKDEEIEVLDIPIVELVYPQKAPALIEVLFKVYFSGSNVSKYVWDFGDNSTTIITSEPYLIHKYPEIGEYKLNITIENSKAEGSSKLFTMTILSPQEFMDGAFQENKNNLNKIKSEIDKLDSWLKNHFYSLLDLDETQIQLNTLETQYQDSGSSIEYVEILQQLEDLNIASGFSVVDQGRVQLLLNPEDINLDVLVGLGAGSSKKEPYKDGIVEWFIRAMDVFLESNEYKLTIDDLETTIGSKFKIEVSPKKSLNDVYLVINQPNTALKFSETHDLKEASGSTGIYFSTLGAKTVEVLLDTQQDLLNPGIYFSPRFSKLTAIVSDDELGACNNNGVCESGIGENYKNCRSDCKPWPWILFWIVIAILIGFILYIILQEWYKRHYESTLFKNKDELFNLINFIDNAEKQKLSKSQIFSKLKQRKWSYEQLDYAWNKYKGKRTGLWEIPVLKWAENLKVKKEISKRANIKQAPNPGLQRRTFSPMNRTRPVLPKLNQKPGQIQGIQKNSLQKQNINKSSKSPNSIKRQ
jgi:PKD repeat protein